MSRKFAPITEEELRKKILAFDEDGEGYVSPYRLLDKLRDDIKVEFDCENFYFEDSHFEDLKGMTGIVTLENGLTMAGFVAGGDWEQPLYFIVYWNGKKLRGYVPTDGNPWNTTTKAAYGNDEEADIKNIKKRYPEILEELEEGEDICGADDVDFAFVKEAILKDIQGRIKSIDDNSSEPEEPEGEEISSDELRKHLAKEVNSQVKAGTHNTFANIVEAACGVEKANQFRLLAIKEGKWIKMDGKVYNGVE